MAVSGTDITVVNLQATQGVILNSGRRNFYQIHLGIKGTLKHLRAGVGKSELYGNARLGTVNSLTLIIMKLLAMINTGRSVS